MTGMSMPARLQVTPVQLDDLAPLRIQVGLGDDACGDRAALQRLAQEVEFGLGELLGRIAHEQHPVGRVERAESDDAVSGVEAADARGVDQRESGAQHPAGEPHLDRAQPADVSWIARLGDVLSDRLHRNGLGQRVAVLVRRIEIGGGAGGLRVADDRRHHRDLVRVHRADRRVQQGVHESALAALELAHHGDADGALIDPLLRLVQRAGQVPAITGGGERPALAEAVDRLVDELVLPRHLGGLGDVGIGDGRWMRRAAASGNRYAWRRRGRRVARRRGAGNRGRPGGRRRRGRRPGSPVAGGRRAAEVGLRGGCRRCEWGRCRDGGRDRGRRCDPWVGGGAGRRSGRWRAGRWRGRRTGRGLGRGRSRCGWRRPRSRRSVVLPLQKVVAGHAEDGLVLVADPAARTKLHTECPRSPMRASLTVRHHSLWPHPAPPCADRARWSACARRSVDDE